MQNVPQIVRDRLRAQASAPSHPDANVLTAFAERALTERERAGVLGHLAQCKDCRDIVALSLPVSEPATTVLTPHRGQWLSWPAFRWGFAVAGVAAIAVFATVQIRRAPMQASLPKTTVVARESHDQSVTLQAPQSASPGALKDQTKTKEAAPAPSARQSGLPRPENARSENAPAAPPSALTVPPPHSSQFHGSAFDFVPQTHSSGPNQPSQWQQAQQQSAAVQVPSAPLTSGGAGQQSADANAAMKIPPATQTVAVTAQAGPVQTESTGTRAQTQLDQTSNEPSSQLSYNYAAGPVDKAKPAAAGAQLHGAMTLVALVPRWTINSAGGLQRSFDRGKTWQDVDVAANAAPAAEFKMAARAKTAPVQPTPAQPTDDEKKTLRLSAPPPLFRAVTAIGSDVWAGGSSGALYHSFDAGNHWNRVMPAFAGSTLTADVVGLEFSDAQHGRVTTSTGEVWMTSDNGLTWQK